MSVTLTQAPSLAQSRAIHSARRATSAVHRTTERLASGLRIRGGKDDAAGVALASRLTAQLRSVNARIRNVGDASSTLQIADSALAESGDLISRMRELAVQAASDTNTPTDRRTLQSQVDALVSQLNDVGGSAEFKGISLLDGTFTGRTVETSAREVSDAEALSLDLSDMRADALGTTTTSTSSTPGSATVNSSQDVDGNAISAGDVLINAITIAASVAADDLVSTRDNEASAIAKAAAINLSTGSHQVTATPLANTFTAPGPVTGGNLQNAALFINGVNIGAVAGILANDAGGQLEAAIDAQSGATGVTASVSGGSIVLTAADGRNIEVDGKKNVALTGFPQVNNQMSYGQLQLTASVDITVAGSAPLARIGIAAGTTPANATTTTTTTVDAVSDVSVATKDDANDAIDVLDDALDQIITERATIGAKLTALEHSASRLHDTAANIAQSRGRVVNADFGREAAQLAVAQVRQSAAHAVLAQAGSASDMVLDLVSLTRETTDGFLVG